MNDKRKRSQVSSLLPPITADAAPRGSVEN